MIIANCDSSIVLKSSEIDFPFSSSSSSLNVKMSFHCKATYRWSVKLLQVSSPLKLRNTSYFHWCVEKEEGDGEDSLLHFIEAVGNLDIKKVQPIKNKEN